MLFKIEKENSCHYLLGTMHVGSTEAYTYVAPVKSILDKITCYAAETNLDEMNSLDQTIHYYLPDGQTYRDYLSEHRYQKYKRLIWKVYQVDLDRMQTLLPIVLTNHLVATKISQHQLFPLDHYLWQLAGDVDIIRVGVESVHDQIKTLRQIPILLQFKGLKKMMTRVSGVNQHFKKLSTYYAKGDYNMLYKLSKRELGSLRKPLLYQRNRSMLESMHTLFQLHTSVLVAVGAGHIGGNRGLKAGLLRMGYSVQLM